MTTTVETRLGDRLDLLAGVYLLDPMKWEQITALNPGLNLSVGLYLEPGLLIEIPALMPEKIPDLLPWNNPEDIQIFEPVEVPPDVQPGANPDEILSGSGWLTPAQIKALLQIPNYSFPLSIEEGGTSATTAQGARDSIGAASLADISNLTTGLALKADASAVSAALAFKADSISVSDALALKLDTSVFTSEIALKLDTSVYNAGIALKLDTSVYDAGIALKLDTAARNAANGVAGLDGNSLLAIGQIPLNNFFGFTGGASFRGVPTPAIPAVTTTLTQAGVTADGMPIYWFVNASATTGNRLKSITVAANGNIQIRHHSDDGTVGNILESTASGNTLTNGTFRPGSGSTTFTGASFVPGAIYYQTNILGDSGVGCAIYSDGSAWRRMGNGSLVTLADPGTEKRLTGTTAATQGGSVSVAHGLTGDKILGFTAKVSQSANAGVDTSFRQSPGYTFTCYHDSTNFYITNQTGDSANILSKAFTIIVKHLS
jgi:hypothetical protein